MTEFRPVSENDMSVYRSVTERNKQAIMSIPGVIGLGVGYKHKEGKLVPEPALVVVVKQKKNKSDIRRIDLIKFFYDGMPTDVVEMPVYQEDASKGGSKKTTFKRASLLIGGIQIGNSNLCRFKSGVIGAIVFDEKSGDPLGLSVQHAIGDLGTNASLDCDCAICKNAQLKETKTKSKKKRWWVPPAQAGLDPINHPNSFETKHRIGTLYKIGKKYDAALFKIDTTQKYEPKIVGVKDPINEPVSPRLGVVCEFRSFKTKTEGRIWFVGSLNNDKRQQVCLDILPGKQKTGGGDSGGLWYTKEGLHPIGLHTGQLGHAGYAVATSIQQLVNEFHSFTFQPVQHKVLLEKTSGHNASFVHTPDQEGILCFMNQSGSAEPMILKKFDNLCKPNRKRISKSRIIPLSGISSTTYENSIYGVWRSLQQKIDVGKWNGDGARQSMFTSSYKSDFQPQITTHKNHMLLAYTDYQSERIRIIYTSWNAWSNCWVSNSRNSFIVDLSSTKSAGGPAIASFKQSAFVAWIAKTDNRLRIMEFKPFRQRASEIVAVRKLPASLNAIGDPALAVSSKGQKLILAFTSNDGGLNAYSIGRDWTNEKWLPFELVNENRNTQNSPNLFCHRGKIVCSREA